MNTKQFSAGATWLVRSAGVAILALTTAHSGAALAQAQKAPGTSPTDGAATGNGPSASGEPASTSSLEEVVITGYRKSLNAALDTKRDSIAAVDQIVAEDIAAFPELNLAESIQRVPGVSITRDAGEGRQISVRGLGAATGNVAQPRPRRTPRARMPLCARIDGGARKLTASWSAPLGHGELPACLGRHHPCLGTKHRPPLGGSACFTGKEGWWYSPWDA